MSVNLTTSSNEVLDRGLSRFLEQDKDKLRLRLFFSAFFERFQDLYDAIASVNENIRLLNATGSILDRWGINFNVERRDMKDDEYRKAIFIKIFIDHSKGTISDIKNAMYLLYNPSYVFLREYRCFLQINFFETKKPLTGLQSILPLIVASGVGFCVVEESSDAFRFAECSSETVDFVANDSADEFNIEVIQDTAYTLQVEADTISKVMGSVGLAEIIIKKSSLALDDSSIYFVDDTEELEILQTYEDFIITGGGKLAELIKND